MREKFRSSWFNGFHSNVRKTFVAFASSVWKVLNKAITQLEICWQNFRDPQKPQKFMKPQKRCYLWYAKIILT